MYPNLSIRVVALPNQPPAQPLSSNNNNDSSSSDKESNSVTTYIKQGRNKLVRNGLPVSRSTPNLAATPPPSSPASFHYYKNGIHKPTYNNNNYYNSSPYSLRSSPSPSSLKWMRSTAQPLTHASSYNQNLNSNTSSKKKKRHDV